MTLVESARSAVYPWNSIDAGDPLYNALPQQNIDICLMCPHCAEHCDNCSEWNADKRGRPKASIDYEMLREMMKLRRCNRELCAAFGVSKRTIQRIKNEMKEEFA